MRQAIYDVMRFWLRKGVDGFRVDVIWHLIKDAEFRDNPPNPHFRQGRPPHEAILTRYSTDQPEVLDVVAEMRRVTDEFDARVLIGEVYLPLHRLMAYYGNDLAGAQMPFNFALLSTLWSARVIEKIIADYETALPAGAWPNWVLGNHDRPRVASRVGREQARVAAMLLLTLAGNADAVLRRRDRHAPGADLARAGARSLREERSWHWRRPRRLPHADAMGCDAVCGVFQRGALVAARRATPRRRTSANLADDARSILSLYKALIRLRRARPELVSGSYAPVAAEGDMLLYRREADGAAILVALNLGAEPVSLSSDTISLHGEILLSTHLDRAAEAVDGALDLRGNEGVDRIGRAVDRSVPGSSGDLPARSPGIGVDIASLQQIVQPADAIPAITVGLQHQRVPAARVGVAVVFRKQVDQELSRVTGKPGGECDFTRRVVEIVHEQTELLRQS